MAKKMKGIKVICLLLLLALVAIAAPVSAVTLTVTLNKTYQFQGADLSTVNVIDLGNPAQSQVGILTTAGAGSDVQMIQAPQITSLERNFTQMSGQLQREHLNNHREPGFNDTLPVDKLPDIYPARDTDHRGNRTRAER